MKHTLSTFAIAGALATGASVITGTAPSSLRWSSSGPVVSGQTAQQAAPVPAAQATPAPPDPVRELVGHLELEKYKATLKGLAQFGDRQQGTKRNRDAVDWIEAQLKSYGCTNTERVIYTYAPAARAAGAGQPAAGAGQRAGGQGRGGAPTAPPTPGSPDWVRRGQAGGSTYYGYRGRTGVNSNLEAQPNEKLRELNSEPSTPGERQEVFCTKVGTTRPQEMYIIGAHMDGLGKGEAVNDDGSGTALVMELARIFHMPGVTTDVSIRFALWNNEESGLNGARAYAEQREKLQGIESPAGSGKYPEPRWLGMIQHDMMMWDHGMPRADGTLNPEQRPEADVNIEFQSTSKFADQSMKLAFMLKAAADAYTTHYPAMVGPHMTNTDSGPFQDLVAAISLRENERGMQTGAGWNPHWHQPTDLFATFSDKDFLLGLNAAQVTLGGVARLAGAKVVK
ncbi:MAG: M28 family peptidase [Vicinamibacterales bacterium]